VIPLKDNIPTDRVPVVTIALILINVIVYLISIRHGGSLLSGPSESTVVHYAAIPYAFTHYGHHCGLVTAGVDPFSGTVVQQVACEGQAGVTGTASVPIPTWFSAFSAMFMHGGLLHIGGNMLFLWIFGNNVEDVLGRVRFLVWYLLGGIAATAAQTFVTLHFGSAQDASVPNVGASGAIAAVLGAYFLLLPRASVLTAIFLGFFFIFREIPAIFFLGIWIALQALDGTLSVTTPQAGGGVAFFAHIGGFAFGILTIHLAKQRDPLQPVTRYRWR
jgi:membrane associated rhomboid family serine protease